MTHVVYFVVLAICDVFSSLLVQFDAPVWLVSRIFCPLPKRTGTWSADAASAFFAELISAGVRNREIGFWDSRHLAYDHPVWEALALYQPDGEARDRTIEFFESIVADARYSRLVRRKAFRVLWVQSGSRAEIITRFPGTPAAHVAQELLSA